MRYERLTRSDNSHRPYRDECFKCIGKECNKCDYDYEVWERLAELEDKIEQGTLIELPCKVGDTVYWVWEEYTNGKQKLSIEEWEVEEICIKKNEWAVKGLGEELEEGVRQFFWCHSSKFGIWWFLTREEAEKRLKELQE